MAHFRVKVREVHYCERMYYIEADNKKIANKMAKAFDYDDADAGEWTGTEQVKILSTTKV